MKKLKQVEMKIFISIEEALDLTLSSVDTVGTETLPLDQLTGRILTENLYSKVDSPSKDASLKDGYAVLSEDLKGADTDHPTDLKIVGRMTAGSQSEIVITNGQSVRITTGASLPEGADAVLAEEFTKEKNGMVSCCNLADTGRNILKKGSDICTGDGVAEKGEKLHPALVGLMATAGLHEASVYKNPSVAVLATGDEIIAPGTPLPDGKLYASNMVEICAWLSTFSFPHHADLIADREDDIKSAITRQLPHVDALITSGGIWGSEKDLMKNVLDDLHWDGIFYRVKISPGKAVAFGLLEGKPVFCLPGGPPSNEMAFLQLALPALMKMRGDTEPLFPETSARLTETVTKRDISWIKFVHATIEKREGKWIVHPLKSGSRLQTMARKEALIIIPGGCEKLHKGDEVRIQIVNGI